MADFVRKRFFLNSYRKSALINFMKKIAFRHKKVKFWQVSPTLEIDLNFLNELDIFLQNAIFSQN